jgi:hypothetical protein
MSKTLPKPVAAYIAASNAHDVEGSAIPFTDDAVVRDESRDHRGLAAIRVWKAEVTKKFRPHVDVIDAAEADGKTIVRGKVSGNFPGSPVELRYAFTLAGDKIARLEIVP